MNLTQNEWLRLAVNWCLTELPWLMGVWSFCFIKKMAFLSQKEASVIRFLPSGNKVIGVSHTTSHHNSVFRLPLFLHTLFNHGLQLWIKTVELRFGTGKQEKCVISSLNFCCNTTIDSLHISVRRCRWNCHALPFTAENGRSGSGILGCKAVAGSVRQ